MLDQITDRLNALVRSDNIAIELVDRKTGLLIPLSAKGVNAADYLEPWEPGEEGIAPWVVAHNEPQLIVDEARRPAGQPLPGRRPRRRQHHLRPAARPATAPSAS